jgi:hypothetical protein
MKVSFIRQAFDIKQDATADDAEKTKCCLFGLTPRLIVSDLVPSLSCSSIIGPMVEHGSAYYVVIRHQKGSSVAGGAPILINIRSSAVRPVESVTTTRTLYVPAW